MDAFGGSSSVFIRVSVLTFFRVRLTFTSPTSYILAVDDYSLTTGGGLIRSGQEKSFARREMTITRDEILREAERRGYEYEQKYRV